MKQGNLELLSRAKLANKNAGSSDFVSQLCINYAKYDDYVISEKQLRWLKDIADGKCSNDENEEAIERKANRND